MTGVEAAASLFGSEDLASDPFNALGTDGTSTTTSFDELFTGSNEVSGTSDSTIFDPSAFPTDDIMSQYSDSQQNPRTEHDVHPQSFPPGQNGSVGWRGSTESHATNYASDPLSTHGPQEYVPRESSAKQSSGNASTHYTPRTYAPASAYAPYTPYNPPALTAYPAPVSYPSPSKHNPPSTNGAYPQTSTSIHPKPRPPPTSTLTRPKLNNAYDPPFLSTKPNRRTPRTAPDAYQSYNVHQSPNPPTTYTTETTVPSTYYQASTSLRAKGRQASPDSPNNVPSCSIESPAGPPTAQVPKYSPVSNSTLYQNSAYVPGTEASTPEENYPRFGSSTVHSNDAQPYKSERKFSSPETARSHTPRRASTDSNSSLSMSENVKSSYSPEPCAQAVTKAPNRQDSFTNLSQYSPRVSPRKDDPYAPTTCSAHIPRASSPLRNQYPSSEFGRFPAALSLNAMGATSHDIPQLEMAWPHESDTIINTSEGLSPRHAIGAHEHIRQQYAPSPSLVGANDPLSRTSSGAPVVTFGFGGKMITCFHGMPGLNAGFDVAFSARTSSELRVRILQKVLPESVLNTPGPSYPGPLVSDPGSASLSLVRSTASAQIKVKKSGLTTYLLGRIEESSQGLGFLSPPERQHAENKLILVKLLKILIENDGRFFGSPQTESAVRAALVPRLALEPILQDRVSLQATAYQTSHPDETPLSVTNLRPSSLSKIEEFLLQGNRRQAFQYAMDQKLWAHAMIIASSIDKDAWREVVNDFLHQELTFGDEQGSGPHPTVSLSSRKTFESLRVAYSLFSGQGAAAVQEFVPLTLPRSAGLLQPLAPSLPAITPRTPNFASMHPALNIPPGKLSKWAETVAMMVSSPFTPSPEMNGALVALGDQLMANNLIEAAHACYLLSPYVFSSQPPIINGFGAPGTRITLLGTRNLSDVAKDPDAMIFSEILEFAMSLLPTAKGQEPFHGLPHLQAYRFFKAVWLAEIGDVQLASRYCEAITASLSPSSPYTNPALLEQLNGLQQRISGVFHGEKSNSWIGGKITKPSLDSIGGWLEGRFTKLVTGDNDSSSPNEDHSKTSDQQFIGPFAHYSTISSTVPSSRSSPQPTTSNFNQPPPRTNSSMGNHCGPLVVPSTIELKPYSQSSGTSTHISSPKSPPALSGNLETPVANNWWSEGTNGAVIKTPTAAKFQQVQHDMIQSDSDGFISLMDNQSFAFQTTQQATSLSVVDSLEDQDDLGLGNSQPKEKTKAETEEKESTGNSVQERNPAERAVEKTPAPEVSNTGGSWLGRFFGRSDSASTGPIKAKLGEEKSLVYDKELKRWVDKSGTAPSAPTPPPPPPPARAQTASPGMSVSKAPPPTAGPAPPRAASAGVDGPPRPSSAIDLTTDAANKIPPRIRSNLAPAIAKTVSGPTISSPSSTPPPPRPRSQAAKRNIRNRYVDVFQQENSGTSGAH